MYQDTITVFNYHKESGLWYPSVIEGANLLANKASSLTGTGITNADAVDVIIHCTADKMISTRSGDKKYIGPKEYARCADPSGFITFQPEGDFLYDGVWDDLTPVDDNGYDSGLYHVMNEEHDGVYLISSAAFYSLLPHFEIGGK